MCLFFVLPFLLLLHERTAIMGTANQRLLVTLGCSQARNKVPGGGAKKNYFVIKAHKRTGSNERRKRAEVTATVAIIQLCSLSSECFNKSAIVVIWF